MGVPISQMWAASYYVLKQKMKGRKRYPLILMLEPLFRCNLACAGCGKIQYPAHVLKKNLTVEQCLAAADEAGTPIISIPGGEPLLHPQIDQIVEGLVAKKKYVYLCTNALLLRQKLHLFKPSKFLTFSVHMDGAKEDHDFSVCKEGGFELAEEAIKEAVTKGFRVTTNSTFFEHTHIERTRAFFDRMSDLGVEGLMVSPGYSYSKAPDQESFLNRQKTFNLFRALLKKRKRKWEFSQSPLFLEFLMGKRHFECTPWGNITYSPFGWQKPCYLLQEGYAKSVKELIDETKWQNYGRASGNPQCQNCMVHCGYEASAVDYTFSSLKGFWETIKCVVRGVSAEKGHDITPPQVRNFVQTGIYAQKSENPLVNELRELVDFRGDITLELKDGSHREGYLFNITETTAELFPKDSYEKACVLLEEILRVKKSGKDCAEGKSWEAWVNKYKAKKAAQARGEDMGDIEPKPEVF